MVVQIGQRYQSVDPFIPHGSFQSKDNQSDGLGNSCFVQYCGVAAGRVPSHANDIATAIFAWVTVAVFVLEEEIKPQVTVQPAN